MIRTNKKTNKYEKQMNNNSYIGCLNIYGTSVTANIGCLNVHGTHVTVNEST